MAMALPMAMITFLVTIGGSIALLVSVIKGFIRLKCGIPEEKRWLFLAKLLAKSLLLIVLILVPLALSGIVPLFQRGEQWSSARLEQVIAAIENRDKEALRRLFSKRAQEEAEDLDGRMDYLFDFVQGKVVLWESPSGYTSLGPDSDGGGMEEQVAHWCTVTTDQEEYIFFLLGYPLDIRNRQNVGLYMLQVIRVEDKKTKLTIDQAAQYAGIYKPEEQEDQTPDPQE